MNNLLVFFKYELDTAVSYEISAVYDHCNKLFMDILPSFVSNLP